MGYAESARQSFKRLHHDEKQSIQSLAEDAGVTRATIRHIITGQTEKISLNMVEKFCEARGLAFEDFVGIKTSRPAPAIDVRAFASVLEAAAVELKEATNRDPALGDFDDFDWRKPRRPALELASIILRAFQPREEETSPELQVAYARGAFSERRK